MRTFKLLNYSCFVVGITVVWFQTENWIALFGACIASLHFTDSGQAGRDAVFIADLLKNTKELNEEGVTK